MLIDTGSPMELAPTLPECRAQDHGSRPHRLIRALPLGAHWASPTWFLDLVDVRGLRIHVAGLVSAFAERQVTGSAGDLTALPLERAYFELLERASVIDAIEAQHEEHELWDLDGGLLGTIRHADAFPQNPPGATWAYSLSNGVAAGPSWRAACAAAHRERVERDRVLRAWFGQTRPERVELGARPEIRALSRSYDLRAYRFNAAPSESMSMREAWQVAGVFGIPKEPHVPLIYGTAAAATLSEARRDAARECLQRLGFLWGEDIPNEPPEVTPTPLYHQELYLFPPMHARLLAWLDFGHRTARPNAKIEAATVPSGFLDLTPAQLAGKIHIAKAVGGEELPLVFGRGHPSFWGVSETLETHPIA